jgi:hypothetical protein
MKIWSSYAILNNGSEEGRVACIEASGSNEGEERNDEGLFHDSHYFLEKELFFRTLFGTEANCVVTYLVQKIGLHHSTSILGCNEIVTVL